MKSNMALIATVLALCAVAFGLYFFFPKLGVADPLNSALVLSKVTIIGLALVVALMGGLCVVYWALGIADGKQALGLPEGSVRALIAFSLVLAFVCMAAFLYSGTSTTEVTKGRELKLINQAQLDELKSQFAVAYEPARKDTQELIVDSDGKSPLYNVTYFQRLNRAGEDLGKQIFTTLATVFVSVVSFYFGSSTTSSAVAAGAKAAVDRNTGGQQPSGGTGGSPGSSPTTPPIATTVA